MSELVLQEKRTLDEVLISAVKTFTNGCNYRLVKELDDCYYLEYGCYGVLINLVSGDERLLYSWFSEKPGSTKPGFLRKLSGIVSQGTIHHLIKQNPCKLCGGLKFRIKPE